MAVNVGDTAPDFKLKAPGDAEVRLSDYAGKKHVVLAFFPLAFSPMCSKQIPNYAGDAQRFESLGAQVLACSIDNPYALEAWAKSLGDIGYPLLTDFSPHGATARTYGVLREDDFSERAIFIIDKSGIVRYKHVNELTALPNNEDVFQELEKLQ